MRPWRSTRGLQCLLALLVVATFVVAECLRDSLHPTAARVSTVGWLAFGVLLGWWLFEDDGVLGAIRRVGRLLALTAIAMVVACLYYRRAGMFDAGVEIDATYTFVGLGWFVDGAEPLTFAGRTVSFCQMPMQLLGHLPGYLVGFDRLGPFAVHCGILLQVGFLLALLVDTTVGATLAVRAGCVALAAAVFSNRLTVLLCNLTGYGVPAVAVGVMFLSLVHGRRSFERTSPWIGGLLMLALMQHYPGWFFVLPLVVLWVLAGRQPWRRCATFTTANVPLFVVVAMAVASVTLHPAMLVTRVHDVTVLAPGGFAAKVRHNGHYLVTAFPHELVDDFFHRSTGSWHLLDVSPLGGLVAPIIATSWIVSAVALGRRGVGYAGGLVVLAVGLAVLTALQHVVTGFENYRDMMLVVGLATASIGFVLALPDVRLPVRTALVAYGVAVAAYGYVDVGSLVGRRYGVRDYAPNEQALAETLRRYWRSDDGARLRDTALVVVDEHFPLERLYLAAARQHGIALQFARAFDVCTDPRTAIEKMTANGCCRFAVAMRVGTCPLSMMRLGWPPPRTPGDVAIHLFENACDPTRRPDCSSPRLIELPSRAR